MQISNKIVQSEPVNGLNFYSLNTGVNNFVSFKGSFLGGKLFNKSNKLVPELLVEMLDKGTKKRDKFKVANILENVGAKINFSHGNYRVYFSGQCLTKDISMIISLIAEQLIEPMFNEKDLKSVKKRNISELINLKNDTRGQGMISFLQNLYPKNHPNRPDQIDKEIIEIEKLSLEDIILFHKECYGLGNMEICVVGDVEHSKVHKNLFESFNNWKTSSLSLKNISTNLKSKKRTGKSDIIYIPDKSSADLIIGHGIGIDNNHKDYFNIMIGHFILGGNFSSRLMSTIREKEGLTYGIQSSVSGVDNGNDGYWNVWGTFSPKDINKAKKLIFKQLEIWSQKGISQKELEQKKNTICGMYKVSFDRTLGVVARILDTLHRNKPLSFIEEYPQLINDIQLRDVNNSIEKYYSKEKCVIISSGSVK